MPSTTRSPERHDVVVVGARCAGAATALLLARAGHDVVLVDRTTFPADTLSTHAIARSGVVQLGRWGMLDRVLASGAPPLRDIAFHDADGVVTRRLGARHGVDALVAPRRTVLDALLVEAARAAGADVRTGVTVEGVTRTGEGRVSGVLARSGDGGHELAGRLIVGADGLRSRIARAVGARTLRAEAPLGSTHYTYVAGDWPQLEYHLGDGAFGGVFPTHGREACVWVCAPAEAARTVRRDAADVDEAFEVLVRAVPTLAARLAGRTRTTRARGAVALPNHVRAGVGPGWALVGDAAYHRDPVTGHGMSDAFRDADLLAEAIDDVLAGEDEAAALGSYERRRVAMLTPLFDVACEMIRFPHRDRFRALQIRLGHLIDAESAVLAARPPPLRQAA
jgi:2-polyprenyl-6-methoxyphenol hydroxylase-like FAD-dependent oxidoreductase